VQALHSQTMCKNCSVGHERGVAVLVVMDPHRDAPESLCGVVQKVALDVICEGFHMFFPLPAHTHGSC